MNDLAAVKSKLYVYLLSLNCVLGSFLFGYEMMVMGCLQPLVRIFNGWVADSHQEAAMFGGITAALPLGALIGCFIIRKLLPIMGARRTLILLDIGSIIFISLQMMDLSAFILILTRFVLGILIGMNSSVIPKYLLSLSPPSMSGATGSLNQLFITIGIAAAYAMGFTISSNPNSMDKTWESWRLVLFFPTIVCMLRALFLVFVFPFDTLDRLYQLDEHQLIQQYCDIVYERLDEKTLIKQLKLDRQLLSAAEDEVVCPTGKAHRKRFILAMVVGVSGQVSGINAILFYAKLIMQKITGNQQQAQWYCFYLGLAQTAVTLLSGLYLDRFGKRTFMLIGQLMILGTLLSIFLVSLLDLTADKVLIGLIFVHIVGFSLSLGPIIWTYISQILKEQAIIIAFIWFLTFLSAISTEMLVQGIGFGKMCLIYFALELLTFLYVLKFMKETKGLNPRQVEQLFEDERVSHINHQSDRLRD